MNQSNNGFSIAPWLSVGDSVKALDFYQDAFGATISYQLQVPDGVIARLSVQGAEFWIAGGAETLVSGGQGGSIRIILTVPDPDTFFSQAIRGGATEIFPVSDDHGWRVGRIQDPFGHHWEIGRELPY
jgi:PhnB protein